MRIRLKLLWLCALSLLAFAGGCSDDEGASTKLVISVEADLMLSKKLTRVEVETYDPAQLDGSGKPTRVGTRSFAIKTERSTGYAFPFSFGAVKNKADQFLLVVIGFEGENAVVEQKALVGFVDGQSRTLTIYLTTACYQKLCAERNSSTWLQSTCHSTQGTCGEVTMSSTVVTGDDDASTTSTDGGGPSEAGGSTIDTPSDGGNGNDSGPRMDGGPTNTNEAGAMDGASSASDGAQQLDTGNSTTDSGPKDAGTTIDAQPVSCGTLTCPATANCVSTPSPHCECKPGYQGSGTTCTNINDCTATSCAAPSTCVDGVNDFTCTCAAGYVQVTPKTCTQQVQYTSLSSGGDSVGGGTNCARRTDGTVACWGRNTSGQFGNGSGADSNLAVTVPALASAVEIVVGSNYVCGRRSDGTVWCSGSNNVGQLGRGTMEASAVPVQVMGLTGVAELAAGYEHVCARRTTGTVACWGDNAAGQLGNGLSGQNERSLAPVEVVGLTNAVEIAAGVGHTCARRTETGGGTSVVCWGGNSSGQLGNGVAAGNSANFVQVMTGGSEGLVNPIGLALGEWHSCAMLIGGNVVCWGSNSAGQASSSDVSSNDILIPTRVAHVANAVEIGANRFYTCARLTNGSVSCWGGWPGRTSSPTTVIASGAAEIGSGYIHSCVRKTDGSIVCWGQNTYGQLGNGVTPTVEPPYTVTPVTVRAN